ncbi:MAG: N-acetyltransferase family protein [Candidatus Kariarchaeaceae archaeon]
MEIEIVNTNHREAIIKLMKLYFDFYEVEYPDDTHLDELVTELSSGTKTGIQFIAMNEDDAVGFATLYFTYSTLSAGRITVMNDLYVIKKWRGKDVARMLFEVCKSYSRENGYLKMEWVTATDNYRGQGFYDKMGGQKSEWLLYSVSTSKYEY